MKIKLKKLTDEIQLKEEIIKIQIFKKRDNNSSAGMLNMNGVGGFFLIFLPY